MNTEHQPDDQIDKVLAALKAATPPEGLENRITQRLAHVPAPTHHESSRWRTLLPTTTPAGAFWRGAATGAAFALLAVAAVLLLQPKTTPSNGMTANAPAANAIPLKAAGTPTAPCAQPAILHPHPLTGPATETASIPGSPAGSARWSGSSHPIPSSPLTTQERELIRLAQTTDPKVLATMNSEHQAQLEAENAAQFEKFFTPPPRPPAPPDQSAANPQPSPANPEFPPQVNPEASPQPEPANPETSPAVN